MSNPAYGAGAFLKANLPTRIDDALAEEAEHAANLKRWNAEIDARDKRKCRACGKQTDPEATGLTKRAHRHHIVYASAGGSDEPFNRVTLCPKCHNAEHHDKLRFSLDGGPHVGINANEAMEFWRKDPDGQWYLSRRETAPGIYERD